MNRTVDVSPDSVLNIKTTIERHDPSLARPPQPEDFRITLTSGNSSIAEVRANENGFNIGLRQSARSSLIGLEVDSPLQSYLPVVMCSETGSPDLITITAGRKKYCEVKVYFLDETLGEPAGRILKVSKRVVNAGLANETDDESEFRIDIVDPLANNGLLASLDGSESGVFFGLPGSDRFEPVERENDQDYFPLYSGDCSAFSTLRFRDCLITNYSIRYREQRADRMLRVVTTIESFDPRGGPAPTAADFRVRVLANGQVIDSFPGSQLGSNLAIRNLVGREISIDVSGPAGYLPTLSDECNFDRVGGSGLKTCEIKVYYLETAGDETVNVAYRITKRLVQPTGDSGITESSFTLGVFRSGEDSPLLTVPGSSTGVVTGVTINSPNISVREINVPAGYVALYSNGCNVAQLWPGEMEECVVTNVYVGASPPKANFQRVSVGEDGLKAFRLSGSDPDSNVLNFQILSMPSNGTLSGNAPDLVYTPNPNYHGTDSFTFRVNAGQFFSEGRYA